MPLISMQHPLPRVLQWRERTDALVGLGGRHILWSEETRWREDALRALLDAMAAHEVPALIREFSLSPDRKLRRHCRSRAPDNAAL